MSIAWSAAGDGPPYVLARGWVSHIEMMLAEPAIQAFFEPLREHFQVVLFDARGNGLSERNPPSLTLDGLVADLEAVADLFDDPLILHGSAFGGPIAVEFAARHPDRVSHLLLDGTYGCGEDLAPPESRDSFLSMLELLRTRPEAVWAALAQMTGAEAPEARANRVERAKRSIDPLVALDLYRLGMELDVRERLPALEMPALVIHTRDNSSFSLHCGRRLASSIPGAQLVTLPGDSANLWDEHPQAALDAIGKFLGTGALRLGDIAPPGETPPLAVLFTDIVDSTRTIVRTGDARSRAAFRVHDRITQEAIQGHRGRVVKQTGDGFLVAFDSVTGALRSCGDIQAALSRYNAGHPELEVHVSMGLNAGEATTEGGDVFGVSVNLAARLAAEAGADEVLVSSVVRDLAAGKGFEFVDRGVFRPKGFDEDVPVFEFSWQAERHEHPDP